MAGPVQLVIVALPTEDDYVRRISSDKEPHLTLLYLGQNTFSPEQITLISNYIEYAASMTPNLWLEVDRRGELGDSQADVLFFSKQWSYSAARLRSQLLQNDLIQAAYNSADQFDQWQPHLTLGFPETPAKPDTRDYPGISYVTFDRIALWTADSSGPTFPLKSHEFDVEVAMSQTEQGRTLVADLLKDRGSDFLSHHGIKGMKWGVRKADTGSGSSDSSAVSDDSKAADAARSKINASGTKSLSNQELQGLINRMNLEKQYSTMVTQNHNQIDHGLITAQKILKIGGTIENARRFLGTPTGQAVTRGLKGAFSAAKVAAAFYSGGTSAAAGAGGALVVRTAANHFTNVGN